MATMRTPPLTYIDLVVLEHTCPIGSPPHAHPCSFHHNFFSFAVFFLLAL
jgi:hypothetical protein